MKAKTYTKTWTAIKEVVMANHDAGFYFFTFEAMSYFHTRLESNLLAYRHFITSEITVAGIKRYTVRVVSDDGRIDTVGELGQFTMYGHALDRVLDIQSELDLEEIEAIMDRGDDS